jgi:hypothetical protein
MKTADNQAGTLFIIDVRFRPPMSESFKTPACWEHAIMAFQKYAAFFQPHELEALNAAYDAAWEKIVTNAITPGEALNLKNRLSQVILASACNGERDPKQLEQIAVRALASRRGMQPSAEQC